MDAKKARRSKFYMAAWLTVVWCVLWRDFTIDTILFGLLLALVVSWRYKLPPVLLSGRFNALWTAVFIVRMVWKLIVASMNVSWLAISQGPRLQNAVLGVQLRSKDDLVLTAVGHTLALIPGSLVIEVDRSTSTLYLHFMDATNESDVDTFRKDALLTEALIIRAIGMKSEVELVKQEAADRKAGRPVQHDGLPPYQREEHSG